MAFYIDRLTIIMIKDKNVFFWKVCFDFFGGDFKIFCVNNLKKGEKKKVFFFFFG